LLLTLVALTLSALLTPMVITQLRATTVDVDRLHGLHAAESGLEVGLSQLRAADDGTGTGVLSRLPCGPFQGTVGIGAAGNARYQVTIAYFGTDPTGKSDAWLAANAMTCLPGAGTYNVPGFALLRAKGTDVATGPFPTANVRELRATYKLRTSNENIPGGLVHVYKTSTSNDLCMDAGSTQPAAGTAVQMQACDDTSRKQQFAYQRNLNLVLVSSLTALTPQGMCLDAGTPHLAGSLVRFQPCTAVTSAKQQWSLNDSANFEGTSDGVNLDGFCFNVQSQDVAGSFVILGQASASKCRRGYDNIETFSPDAQVGAGAASAASGQLVNFRQFARCIDVTEANLNFAYMIVWPCKQAPDPSRVLWNQRWAMPTIAVNAYTATGTIVTNPPSGPYCLRSPRTTAASRYVTVTSCPGATATQSTTWTVHGDTGEYDTSYIITDADDHCLAPLAGTDYYPNGQQISKLVVRDCDGSTLQKWNANPNVLKPSPLQNISER
jgi:hypothetical protein